jgi:hypothetical protein
MSQLETDLLFQIRALGLPQPETEYRFHNTRKWRFDLAWPAQKIACEVEGGTWINGRHSRGSGFMADCEKYNEAALYGWAVLRVTGEHIRSGDAVRLIEKILNVV